MKKRYFVILAAVLCLLTSCQIDSVRDYRKTYGPALMVHRLENHVLNHVQTLVLRAYYADQWKSTSDQEIREYIAWNYFSQIYERDGVIYTNQTETWDGGGKGFCEEGCSWTGLGEGYRIGLRCVGDQLWEVSAQLDWKTMRYEADFQIRLVLKDTEGQPRLATVLACELPSGTFSYQELVDTELGAVLSATVAQPLSYKISALTKAFEWPLDGVLDFSYAGWDEADAYFSAEFFPEKYLVRWGKVEEAWDPEIKFY